MIYCATYVKSKILLNKYYLILYLISLNISYFHNSISSVFIKKNLSS